ncbi:MAG: hypoxanthine phosphoribosyltransferase [Actinomycetota bacterium]
MTGPFVEVIDEGALQRRVEELGREITESLPDPDPVVIGVLKGSVPFLTDLTRHLPLTVEVDFLNLTRFGREGRVSVAMDLSVPLEGRSVLIVEDIVDTGLTLATMRKMLQARGAESISTVALLDKAKRRIVDVPVEHRGFEVGDEYLLGYGMDWQGRYRNVRSIWAVMDLSVLKADPDSFGRVVFGNAGDTAGGADPR